MAEAPNEKIVVKVNNKELSVLVSLIFILKRIIRLKTKISYSYW